MVSFSVEALIASSSELTGHSQLSYCTELERLLSPAHRRRIASQHAWEAAERNVVGGLEPDQEGPRRRRSTALLVIGRLQPGASRRQVSAMC